MSVEIDWEALTSPELAENIREFLHIRFKQIKLPRFIKSVEILGFEFGATPPQIEIKDITDPLPDFYQRTDGEEEDDGEIHHEEEVDKERKNGNTGTKERESVEQHPRPKMSGGLDTRPGALRSVFAGENMLTPLGVSTPGILGYFGLPRTAGLSGSQTPLAAVAGRQMSADPGINSSEFVLRGPPPSSQRTSASRPSTAKSMRSDVSDVSRGEEEEEGGHDEGLSDLHHRGTEQRDEPADDEGEEEEDPQERRATDVQIVLRVQYSGDVKLSLTAEILLDYPMHSFVGIPLRLNITGLKFDGVGILAWIKNRAHFCFLNPEDAASIVGEEQQQQQQHQQHQQQQYSSKTRHVGSLLEEIRIESEIGQRGNGKQSLRNLDKVEKFVIERLRGIFEDELVYPSYWTFLI
ncbi:MAG: hypothetical protein M1823_002863 [Watsoniomyces obsoletus]|nr:MAG: hypothetical protein M1823_002863 [Watsoniomyces obsoletus]